MRVPAGSLIETRALLFDMDGTLTDSTKVVDRIWKTQADRWGVDFETFRRTMHGRRAVDTMRALVPAGVDPEIEVKVVDEAELVDTGGIVAIAGATRLIAALPANRWALVTSAKPDLAAVRMGAAGLPLPEVVVTSLDVAEGKPNPKCFEIGAARLGVRPQDALVLEDAPAGFAAGHAAGCRVIALTTTHDADSLADEDWLPDLSYLSLESISPDGWLQLRVF